MPFFESVVPTIVNGMSQLLINEQNQQNYRDAQERANDFAKREREMAQQYNSLENQYAQMANVGLNPNLMNGQMFQATSPVSNQSVAPPQEIAPQMPVDTLAQSKVAQAQSQNLNANTITTDMIRDNLVKTQGAEYEFKVAQKNTEEQTLKNAQKQFEVLDTTRDNLIQSIIESDARTQNIRENTSQLRELRGTWRKKAEAEINLIIEQRVTEKSKQAELKASASHLIAVADNIKWNSKFQETTFDARVKQQNSQTNEAYWSYQGARISANNLRTQGSISQWQLGQYETYGELNNVISTCNGALQVIDGLVSLDVNPISNYVDKNMNRGMKVFSTFTNPSVNNPFDSGY